ncbi:polysaccharide deacetylase [Pseudomonas sp. EA_5y_Pfl2_R50]|uniref:polysaccharide deacetylase n=1 Tax=Pseudomonas sp. EA_5y_Pfl2_R50 TaxID=3088691 RepID=UPI0030DCCF04
MHWLRMASMVLLWISGCPLVMSTELGNTLMMNQLDRTGWPDALTSQASVDTASRAEVLMFGKALLASEALDEEGLEQRLGVPHVQLKSVRQVRESLWDHLLNTYHSASKDCDGQPFCPRVRGVADLRQLAAAFTGDISPGHALWASKSQGVHEQMLNEQLRVAVLLP